MLPAYLEPPHVRDVEHPCTLPYGVVLIDDARVLHRHRIPGERHHPPAEALVLVVERRTKKSSGSRFV